MILYLLFLNQPSDIFSVFFICIKSLLDSFSLCKICVQPLLSCRCPVLLPYYYLGEHISPFFALSFSSAHREHRRCSSRYWLDWHETVSVFVHLETFSYSLTLIIIIESCHPPTRYNYKLHETLSRSKRFITILPPLPVGHHGRLGELKTQLSIWWMSENLYLLLPHYRKWNLTLW